MLRLALLALALSRLASPACAKTLWLDAYDGQGRPLRGASLLEHIAPRARRPPPGGGFYVTDIEDVPAAGRPWLLASGSSTAVLWSGPSRVRVSLPWPIAEDGFSTVSLDKDGAGYGDGDRVLLNEAIALTEDRLFRESLEERLISWDPAYKPSRKARELQRVEAELLDQAKRQAGPAAKAILYEKALTALSAAWSKMLFEHGAQVAADPKRGPELRWGLTLDESLGSRMADFDPIASRLAGSGANWARLVFRQNPNDFAYARSRSFLEYDAIVAALRRKKVHLMGSVLDSTLWPKAIDPGALAARARNLALHYEDTIRSWEVASEPNGDWQGGSRNAIAEERVGRAVEAAAAAVKRVDPSLETLATLYWWEGTAGDDRHPTFSWLARARSEGFFSQIDVVGLSIYPDDNPMGLAFDTAFRRLHQAFGRKRLIVGGYGYVEGRRLDGYWWLDPANVGEARKDLVILYTGAAAAVPASLGGGFYWPALGTMLDGSREGESLLSIYRRALQRLGR